jgi:hypothetical protein
MALEQINKLKPKENRRHCEGRRPVAIHTAILFAPAFPMAEPLHGLPPRFAPRNDDRLDI